MSKFVRFFRDLSESDTSIAGGKGASLGKMTGAGFPIPPGFVVLSTTFARFLEETDINVEIKTQLRKVDPKKTHTIDDTSEVLRSFINRYEIPKDLEKEILAAYDKLKTKYVAVRSSATAEDSRIASWAGELETYLGVQRKDLIKSVKKCWSSLFTPRAIFYRIGKKLNGEDVFMAVVIQKMVESEVAGVCFTVHPVTKNRNQMVIEASWGLGESVAAGKVTPDTYIIDKLKVKNETLKESCLRRDSTGEEVILDKNIQEQFMEIKGVGGVVKEVKVPVSRAAKQCLPDNKIIELAQICQKIEQHYGFPCDIEWALEKGEIYIVQSRPITTL